jgi:hypothetical protein
LFIISPQQIQFLLQKFRLLRNSSFRLALEIILETDLILAKSPIDISFHPNCTLTLSKSQFSLHLTPKLYPHYNPISFLFHPIFYLFFFEFKVKILLLCLSALYYGLYYYCIMSNERIKDLALKFFGINLIFWRTIFDKI